MSPTVEPDPDNAGVGNFHIKPSLCRAAFLFNGFRFRVQRFRTEKYELLNICIRGVSIEHEAKITKTIFNTWQKGKPL
jgi:hypothetical protein